MKEKLVASLASMGWLMAVCTSDSVAPYERMVDE
jgi:hypothetical protein